MAIKNPSGSRSLTGIKCVHDLFHGECNRQLGLSAHNTFIFKLIKVVLPFKEIPGHNLKLLKTFIAKSTWTPDESQPYIPDFVPIL